MEIKNIQKHFEMVDEAEQVVMHKLKAAKALLDDVKTQLVHGTDMIATSQIQEWSVAIPIMCQDLTPYKEAYALTKKLFEIENKKIAAKNLLELDKKKTEIDQLNKLAGIGNETNAALTEYMRDMLTDTQDNLTSLNSALKKILEARNRGKEDK